MNFELRPATENDGWNVYDMLQEMPADENGFTNTALGKTPEEFREWLRKRVAFSRGEGLENWMVPESYYWLFVDGVPVGVAKLRHRLTEALREAGGHIGYGIRPSQRGKRYGNLILKLLIGKARDMGLDKVLLTCKAHNEASRRTIEANGGLLERRTEEELYYWITIK